jgi:S-DNA-T family DNA segregation ATPase FtsK/SpoIIIE
LVFLSLGILIWLSLFSYHSQDPSWNTATGSVRSQNLIGPVGSYLSDLCFQTFGLGAFSFPILLFVLGWKWVRSEPFASPWARVIGSTLFLLSVSVAFSLGPRWTPFGGAFPASGIVGMLLGDYLRAALNMTGAGVLTATCLIVSVYMASTFEFAKLGVWFQRPMAWARACQEGLKKWRQARVKLRLARKAEKQRLNAEAKAHEKELKRLKELKKKAQPLKEEAAPQVVPESGAEAPPWETHEIPIRTLDQLPPEPKPAPFDIQPEPVAEAVAEPANGVTPRAAAANKPRTEYRLPPTDLLNEPAARNPYDEQELKDTAARIKSKFEEFNVLGSVVQINPGPVVTTFEFKPDAGIKYTRITTLMEDLCLGLQAESILIERIPGKPTVGIEVPNSKRELISLRQILESDEFQSAHSRLPLTLGKDINGRIKVTPLDSMPHALIAGSTGSGKSVMLNSLIMSVLYKATPDDVRMILVDPKRLEMGLYEGIPHLLTPVITDTRKATNALRNAVLEMERRLRLLAEQGVRNIEQYNKKIRQLQLQPRSLFEDDVEGAAEQDLETLPYILILIDELADLMMVEGHNVEQAVTRLAQMARAVGMHLVLATQRPSVDVITGLIKANFPARISFRVATRVDSRTILDVMGAEHLLGKGDMLFLPPGSSRLIRVHGAFVTEQEINRVVDFWKQQARPEYDQSFLIAPPSEEEEETPVEELDGEQDPLYQDAVRVVLEMGKASTSTLQRRLRLGYGRAARILDTMQRDGIIGPPDGSRPREVLKRPDWLEEVEQELR